MEDIAIAKTILSLARNLNLEVVAEGVENIAQLEFFGGTAVRKYRATCSANPFPHPSLPIC